MNLKDIEVKEELFDAVRKEANLIVITVRGMTFWLLSNGHVSYGSNSLTPEQFQEIARIHKIIMEGRGNESRQRY